MIKAAKQKKVVHRFFGWLGGTPAGAWFFARTLHHMDRAALKMTNGRGSLAGWLTGLPIITLTTTGAKSGKARLLPLVGILDGECVVLIASNFGQSHHPAWYHNLRANPEAIVSLNGTVRRYTAYEAKGEEREKYWRRAVAHYAGYERYKGRIKGRNIPVMVLVPVKDGQ
ncbi:MAG: nitroreductase family deazaflavin-dependent oxidoreductase [Anaerolineae bacterium]|nr:nitroreductase family deazaflavin-dependent oxidoreductase [Anaerolineae bacterium]